jgi:uncharacterized Rmd1/YagE family protein
MNSQSDLSAPPRKEQPGPSSRAQALAGPYSYEERSDAEKMTKREREENGLARFTAYATAEGYRLKLLQAFLKREHGVGVVRVYDDCIYAVSWTTERMIESPTDDQVYNLPLLPGYGASTVVRSSPANKSPGGVSMLERMTMAEDMGYNDSYFPSNNEEEQHYGTDPNEYILAHSPPVSPRDLLLSATSPPRHLSTSEQRESDREQQEQEQEHEREQANDEVPQSPDNKGRDSETSTTTAETPDIQVPDSFDEDEEPILAPADREHNLIETGTHMSPEHPGYLEHVPSEALSPDQLHPERERASEPIVIRQEDAAEHQRAFTGQSRMYKQRSRAKSYSNSTPVAEAVFYAYGVSVFFGFTETQEKEIMEDCLNAGAWSRPQAEDDWEVEECHYVVRLSVVLSMARPR